MAKRDKIKIEVWSEHFLGTTEKSDRLITLINQVDGGLWRPDKWGHFEPIREAYESGSEREILTAIQQERGGRIANDIYFRKKKPTALLGWLVWRSKVPSLNSFWADLEADAFSGADGPDRVKRIVAELVGWAGAVYASARHTGQQHYRVVQKTPEERLSQLDWLTFFGEAYIDMFGGRKRVLSGPFFDVSDLPGGLLLTAAPRPNSPEMTDSDKTLVALEAYLGKDAFAGQGYPHLPCRVPQFDLSETIVADNAEESQQARMPGIGEPLVVKDQESQLPKAVVVFTSDNARKKTQ